MNTKARPCVRCHRVKPARRFPPHGWPHTKALRERPVKAGSPRLCMACIEDEAHAMNDAGYENRERATWIEGGVKVRRCYSCRVVKPWDEFPTRVKGEREGQCQPCKSARSNAYKKQRRRTDPEFRARLARREYERKKNDPEQLAKAKAATKRWRAKVDADPVAHAEKLETDRLNYKLRRERLGLPVRPAGRKPQPAVRVEEVRRVPSAPVAAMIARLLEHREEFGRQLNDPSFANVGALCLDLGIDERRWRDWRDGIVPTMGIGMAERIMLAADVEPSEVFSADDYPEVLVRFETVTA